MLLLEGGFAPRESLDIPSGMLFLRTIMVEETPMGTREVTARASGDLSGLGGREKSPMDTAGGCPWSPTVSLQATARHSGWTQGALIAIKATRPEFGPFCLQKQVGQEGWMMEKQPGVWGWEGIGAQLFPRCPGSGRRRQNQNWVNGAKSS